MAILAIDQGGSKTVALLADTGGNVMGVGMGFGACHFTDGLPRAMNAITLAVDQALTSAALHSADIEIISAGLAGANWPDEIELLERSLREQFGVRTVAVYNDCLIALRGGTDNPDAIVLCGGTGLNCAVTTDTGVVHVYNNYVDDIDQGGGALGERALLAIFQSEIGIRPATRLREMALSFFKLERIEDLLLGYQRKQLKRPLQEVAFLVFEAADASDPVALNVIYELGVSLSQYVVAGARRFGLVQKAFDVVLSGGIFKARNPLLQETISAQVHRVSASARIVNAEYEPVVGALVMGLEKARPGGADEARATCRRSATKIGLVRFSRGERG